MVFITEPGATIHEWLVTYKVEDELGAIVPTSSSLTSLMRQEVGAIEC